MSDGLWTGQGAQEPLNQALLTRHRLLTINLDPTLAPVSLTDSDASGLGGRDPNTIPSGTVSARGSEGGPHFIMSPETPDGRPTLGFEFALIDNGLTNAVLPQAAGFTVTVWVLIGTTMNVVGNYTPSWASFLSRTGVQYNELYRSFDVNATAVRFQITNYDFGAGPGRSLTIAFAEL